MTDRDLPSIDVAIAGPFGPDEARVVWRRIAWRLAGADAAVTCDVGAVGRPDVVTVDGLARLQLLAGRSGCRIRLRQACPELRDLLDLTGLLEVLPCSRSDLELRREAEEREPPRRVEEERDPGDPVT